MSSIIFYIIVGRFVSRLLFEVTHSLIVELAYYYNDNIYYILRNKISWQVNLIIGFSCNFTQFSDNIQINIVHYWGMN